MSNRVIANCITHKLAKLNITTDTIVVLKGIPISIVDPSIKKVNLSDIVANKLSYFMSVVGKRKFLSYEEFLLLSDFVVSQYKDVIILNNKLFLTRA